MTEQEQKLYAWCRELSERLTDQHEVMMDLKQRLEKLEKKSQALDSRTKSLILYR